MIRVLVADDSATARALLREILSSDPELQIVGEAKDGAEAVAQAQRLRPNVVTMDLHMPGIDGLTATKEIMITVPTPIIIVTGSVDTREVELAMHALRAGAVTVLAKPPGPEAPSFQEAARQIVTTVKSMAQVKVVRHWRTTPGASFASSSAVRSGLKTPIVAMATSTGGPVALQRVFSELDGNFPAPILVVQHISSGFVAGLATWLNEVTDLIVKVAEQGEKIVPATVYLAPDDRHLGLSNPGDILLSDGPPIGGFRPSGNYLFESVARVYGKSAIAVILTGMGEDGVGGLGAIRQAGGRIIAQDETTSVVYGMPKAAIAAGLADIVLPLDAIARRLEELVQKPNQNLKTP